MKPKILCTILSCVVAAGFVAWRVHAVKSQHTAHFAILEDFSMSHPDGCKSLLGLGEQVLRTQGATANSTLTVLVIGDQTTSYEPQILGRYFIPRTRKVLEGRAADQRRLQDILHDMETKCLAVRRTKISPIVLGVKQAIADLRAQGCTENSHCELFVDSDLEENVEPAIKTSLDNRTGGTLWLPSPINNEGIKLIVCGLAVTSDRISNPASSETREARSRAIGRDDRLRRIWLKLFSNSESVKFQPYCPQPSRF